MGKGRTRASRLDPLVIAAVAAAPTAMSRVVQFCLAALAAIGAVAARPAPGSHGAVVIWHGLGDSFDAEGMTQLAETIQERYPGTFVHVIRQGEDGAADRKASFFGNAAAQVDTAYSQLLALPELRNGFDAVGFSQGGVLLRALVQEHAHELPPIRKLITLGSPHLGVARLPPCGNGDLLCRATEWALRAGVWTTYAQSKVIPAQYFRNQEDIARYLVSSGWCAAPIHCGADGAGYAASTTSAGATSRSVGRRTTSRSTLSWATRRISRHGTRPTQRTSRACRSSSPSASGAWLRRS